MASWAKSSASTSFLQNDRAKRRIESMCGRTKAWKASGSPALALSRVLSAVSVNAKPLSDEVNGKPVPEKKEKAHDELEPAYLAGDSPENASGRVRGN